MEKVIVFGLDGATFRLLTPWMDAGHLPRLRAIRDAGVSGLLESSIPPVTAPAWQCFMTGKNPGKHGVHYWLRRKADSYEETPVTTMDGRALWEYLSDAGKRVCVLNVPFTWPLPAVNGVVISGFNTPSIQGADFCNSPELLADIESRLGPYPVYLKTPPLMETRQFEGAIDRLLDDVHGFLDYHFDAAEYILSRSGDFDFVMFYEVATDRVQHALWTYMDPTHPEYDPAEAGRVFPRILRFYQTLDARMGRLIDRASGSDTHVFVVSDHGQGPGHTGIDLNAWLLTQGYIRIKRRAFSQLKHAAWRLGWTPSLLRREPFRTLGRAILRRKVASGPGRREESWAQLLARSRVPRLLRWLFLSMNDIDWTRTRAYCCNAYGQISINLAGREPQGCVTPGAEYDALKAEVAEKLAALVDPVRRQPVNGAVHLTENVYWGAHARELPDITFLPLETGYLAGARQFGFIPRDVFVKSSVENAGGYGIHSMHGIFLAGGPALKHGVTVEGLNLMDVTPTVLYLLGATVPRDMDGRVATDIFHDDFLRAHPIEYVDGGEAGGRPSRAYSKEEEALVLDRLEGLGYL